MTDTNAIAKLIEPAVKELGFDLVRVAMIGGTSDPTLQIMAERPDGKVRLCTEAVSNEQGEVRAVRLIVLDNGPGFSDKVLKRAFEPYVTTKSKGTGLGLAVVKKIADEHGARVRIVNLGTSEGPGSATGSASTALGAQVSLSFSKLAPVPLRTSAAGIAAQAGSH